MSLLYKVKQSFATYVSPRKPSIPHVLDSSTTAMNARVSNKRKAPKSPNRRAKKIRLNLDADYEEEDSPFEGSTLLASTPSPSKAKKPRRQTDSDRTLMPPPATPKVGSQGGARAWAASVARSTTSDEEDYETVSRSGGPQRSPNARTSPIDLENMDAEQKSRYQEAIKLPENSGIWVEAEKDLFYHLALRGFKPLLPANWMVDFGTFPLSLFCQDASRPPLLQSTSNAEFRAIRALRSLNEMGQRVRDRALASRKLRPEPLISNTVNMYLNWALSDAGVHHNQRPRAPPVHAVVTMQKGQSTQDAIIEMTTQLYRLAARYRRLHDIHPSIEPRDLTPISNSNDDETQIADDEDDDLPILTGLMICSSLIVVFTLNAHILPRPSILEQDQGHSPNPGPGPSSHRSDTKEESGLRFIAKFDFSESGVDVWNALAIAIVAMHVRKMALLQLKRAEVVRETEEGGRWEFVDGNAAGEEEEDPDA